MKLPWRWMVMPSMSPIGKSGSKSSGCVQQNKSPTRMDSTGFFELPVGAE